MSSSHNSVSAQPLRQRPKLLPNISTRITKLTTTPKHLNNHNILNATKQQNISRSELISYLNSSQCTIFNNEFTINGTTLDTINSISQTFRHTTQTQYKLSSIALCHYLQVLCYTYSSSQALLQHIHHVMHLYRILHKVYNKIDIAELCFDLIMYLSSVQCTIFNHLTTKLTLSMSYIEQLMAIQQQYSSMHIIDILKEICKTHAGNINSIDELVQAIKSICHFAGEQNNVDVSRHNNDQKPSVDYAHTTKFNVSVLPATPQRRQSCSSGDANNTTGESHASSARSSTVRGSIRLTADDWLDSVNIQSYIHSPRSNVSSKRNSLNHTPRSSRTITPVSHLHHSSIDTDLSNLLNAINTIHDSTMLHHTPLIDHSQLLSDQAQLVAIEPPASQRRKSGRLYEFQHHQSGDKQYNSEVHTNIQSLSPQHSADNSNTIIPNTAFQSDDLNNSPTHAVYASAISVDGTRLSSSNLDQRHSTMSSDTILAAPNTLVNVSTIESLPTNTDTTIHHTPKHHNSHNTTATSVAHALASTVSTSAASVPANRATLRASKRQTLTTAATPISFTASVNASSVEPVKCKRASKRMSARHFKLPSDVLLGERSLDEMKQSDSLVSYTYVSSDDSSSDDDDTYNNQCNHKPHHTHVGSMIIHQSKSLIDPNDSYEAKFVIPNRAADDMPQSSMHALLHSLRAGPSIDVHEQHVLKTLDDRIHSLRTSGSNMFSGFDDMSSDAVEQATKIIRQKSLFDSDHGLIQYNDTVHNNDNDTTLLHPVSTQRHDIKFKIRDSVDEHCDTSSISRSNSSISDGNSGHGFMMNVNVISDTGTITRQATLINRTPGTQTRGVDLVNECSDNSSCSNQLSIDPNDNDTLLSQRANSRTSFFQSASTDNYNRYNLMNSLSPLTNESSDDLLSHRTQQLLQPIIDYDQPTDDVDDDLMKLKSVISFHNDTSTIIREQQKHEISDHECNTNKNYNMNIVDEVLRLL